MRVIAGKYKGRRLYTPKDMSVRPTTDRVKEAVFSIIRDNVFDATFLDLCAGTGNIGIEALSRGARHVTFLEKSLNCISLIEKNLLNCGIEKRTPQVELIRTNIKIGLISLHRRKKIFDLIYFDPPYDAALYAKCLQQISDACMLHTKGILLVEHHRKTVLPLEVGSLVNFRNKQYGNTCITFYRYPDV